MFEDSTHGGRQQRYVADGLFQIISTHALTEGDSLRCADAINFHISTHALTEGDFIRIGQSVVHRNFNSRPHGGRREARIQEAKRKGFQLTPSRRATRRRLSVVLSRVYFNSRPHGGRHGLVTAFVTKYYISTHALTEGDG